MGTSALKGVRLEVDGSEVRPVASRRMPYGRDGAINRDPEVWVRTALDVVQLLGGEGCVAVGVTGQLGGLVLLDGKGQPLRPAALWCDRHGSRAVQRFTREHPDLDFAARTGNRATEDYTLARWLVAMEMEPDLPGLVGGVMAVKDYVRGRLCQAPDMVTEANEASDTQLFDVVGEKWDEGIVEAAGVPRHALPGLVSPERVVGKVKAGGLVVPCIAGVGDQVAAAWGVGAWEPGTASVSLGTSGVVLLRTMAADVPEHCGELGLKVHSTGVPGEREVSGSIPALGLALEWAAGMVGGRSPGATGPAGRDVAGNPRFFPYSPLGVRGSVSEVPPGFLAAGGEGVGREEVASGVVSGLAFELATILEELASAGLRVERVVCSGGGARSATLLRLLAACVPVPVYRTTLPSASAVGVALLAARGVGAEAVARPRVKPVPTGDRPRALTSWQEERRCRRGQQAVQGWQEP